MGSFIDVAIIGAGPYGLSVAAHLSALGVEHRIFGKPMQLWREHMPPGMRLKSDGGASDLADANDELTLKKYCAREGLPHDDHAVPVPLSTFVNYGMAFQKRFVPQVEQNFLTSIEHAANGFLLRFEDQDVVMARRVVMAIGVSHFKFLPDFLANLPQEFVTHASHYGSFDALQGKQVTVMGAGASALDTAGLLAATGVDTTLMTRRGSIEFHNPPGPRSLRNRIRAPGTGMGAGWRLKIFQDTPRVFHALPQSVRHDQVSTLLGPSAGWFVKDMIVGKVPVMTGLVPNKASVVNGKLHIEARDQFNAQRTIVTDHLLAGTGYKIDLRKLGFMSDALRAQIAQANHTPILSGNFETSLKGLYFIGPSAMHSFGPLMRFVLGARYNARNVVPAIAKSLAGKHVPLAAVAPTSVGATSISR